MEDQQNPTDEDQPHDVVAVTGQDPAPAPGPEEVAVAATRGAGSQEVVHAADPTVAAEVGVAVAAGAIAENGENAADLVQSRGHAAPPGLKHRPKRMFSRTETELC
eukprot:GHVL01011044.1.p2 GENE.GHVL01011044.1~~GHVL01011044.1.p2  ORF type:complete len:106 (+),score=26.05 GHVL01011044.1:338-655(+)